MNTPKSLLLSLAIATALGACQKPAEPAANAGAGDAKADPAAYTLDESKLPPVNRFLPGDLDPA